MHIWLYFSLHRRGKVTKLMDEVIKTINLTKVYEKTPVVSNLNISINRGEIFGFLGLNGAGKTTTIRMLLGMINPTSGKCYLNGKPVDAGNTTIWNDVGYIVETPHSYPELTVRENLDIIRRLRGITKKDCVDWIIKKLRLKDYDSKKAKHLSLGNAQRLGIAKAMIHKPKILLLDEPTSGLDPIGIMEVRRLLVDLAENSGVTIFISSHRLNEISKIATNIGIIHKGRLIKEIDSSELKAQIKKSLILDGKYQNAIKSVLSQAGYEVIHTEINTIDKALGIQDYPLKIQNEDAIKNPETLVTLLVNAGYPPNLLKVEKENLEEFFSRIIEEAGG